MQVFNLFVGVDRDVNANVRDLLELSARETGEPNDLATAALCVFCGADDVGGVAACRDENDGVAVVHKVLKLFLKDRVEGDVVSDRGDVGYVAREGDEMGLAGLIL